MVQNKKKTSWWLIVAGAALSGYFGYLLNGAWEPGIRAAAFLEAAGRVCAEPFANYCNGTTLKAVVAALAFYFMAVLIYVTSQRNFSVVPLQ